MGNHLRRSRTLDPSRSRLVRRFAKRVWVWALLVLVWVGMWGDSSVRNLVAGGLVGAVVVTAAGVGNQERRGRARPIAMVRFFAFMAWDMAKATALLAWEVVTPRNRIVEGIIAVPLPAATPFLVFVLTGAIGVTPGTVVVDIDEDPCVLYVHVLHLADTNAVMAHLAHMQALALRAFGPDGADDAIAWLEAGGLAATASATEVGS